MSKKKSKLRYKCRHFGIVINIICLICVATYVFAHNDAETAANTTVITSKIKDVEHIKGAKSAGYISFTADNEEYICVIQGAEKYANRREKVQEILSEFETVERNGSLLTIVSTDEQLGILPPKSLKKTWAVGVSNGENILCSLDKHNSDQLKGKIVDLILISIWLLISILYIYLMHFLEPHHKRKKK